MVPSIGVQLERDYALIDAKAVIDERGDTISVYMVQESSVTRDKFSSIIKKEDSTPEVMNSYPINFSPTELDRSNAGLRETTGVIICTAMKDWNDNGYTFQELNDLDMIRGKVKLKGKTYEIKDKSLKSQFSDTYLYVMLGLNRK